MANVTTLTNIQTQMPYLEDGVRQVLEGLVRNLPEPIKFADNLALYTAIVSETKAEVDDDAGAYPVAVICKSRGTAGFVSLWNLDADDVTVGTTSQQFAMPVSGTSGQITACLLVGAGVKTLWGTGLTIAAATTVTGSTAMTNTPVVYLLYASA